MQRRFDITAYSALALHQFDSVDDFLATPPRDGISEIMIGERPLHALFRSRGADTTLVHFSAALARGKGETYPQFGGAALSGSLPVNWLALSDPNYSLPQAPATGWFLGSRTQPLVRSMSSIVRHFSSAGIEEQAILFGSLRRRLRRSQLRSAIAWLCDVVPEPAHGPHASAEPVPCSKSRAVPRRSARRLLGACRVVCR